MQKPKSRLLALTTSVLVSVFASLPSAHAQECDEVVVECERLMEEMAQTRDQAIADTDAVETERDTEAGKRLTFERLYYDERALNAQKQERPRPQAGTWFALGAVSATALGLLVGLVVVAL